MKGIKKFVWENWRAVQLLVWL